MSAAAASLPHQVVHPKCRSHSQFKLVISVRWWRYGDTVTMNNAVDAISPEVLPAWIGSIATSAAVIVAILAIVLTYTQVRLTARQIREAAIREAQNSEDRTRPYIGLDVVTGLAGSPSFDLVITNFGRATARHVRIDLVGEGFKAQSSADEIGPALGRLFAVPFDLAPGARRRVFWYMPDEEESTPRGAVGTPISGEISAIYEWEPRPGEKLRSYKDRLSYDLNEYPKLAPQPASGSTANGSVNAPEVIARNEVHALRAIARHIGELRR